MKCEMEPKAHIWRMTYLPACLNHSIIYEAVYLWYTFVSTCAYIIRISIV